jgi:secondary thiamine-phosphate synthase enzyme
VITRELEFATKGNADVINITAGLRDLLAESGLDCGTATVFAPGATGAVTTLEFEPGVVHDFQRLFEEISPASRTYEHNARLGDGNGHSHVRAGLLGPSLVVPFAEGRYLLGTWQEVCFVCFDNRPRDRRLVVQLMGV